VLCCVEHDEGRAESQRAREQVWYNKKDLDG
jgi:hypothetical protein